jgi:intermediate cleaving peptidase 55
LFSPSEKNSSSRGYKFTLFCNGSDADKAKWDGARYSLTHIVSSHAYSSRAYSTSLEDAAALFKANSALPITSFPSHLKSLTSLSSHVYLDLPASATPRSARSRPKSILDYLSNSLPARREYDIIVDTLSGSKRKPLAPEVSKLRAIKSNFEQDVMRATADISGTAHAKV